MSLMSLADSEEGFVNMGASASNPPRPINPVAGSARYYQVVYLSLPQDHCWYPHVSSVAHGDWKCSTVMSSQ